MKISSALVDWFAQNARSLPWRTEPRDAYRTLISEIMLQQTQVDRVAPRFVEFVDRWPDLNALASASEDEVLTLWSGLGYYRRARMLHRLAQEVIGSGRDRLPQDLEALRALPGIGDYTAAAVGSLAFGLRTPVLDGNVQRVVARMMAFDGDPRTSGARKRMKAWVSDLFGGHQPGVVNEAMMELGATVCTPSGPRCEACPLAPECKGHKGGRPGDFPAPRKTRAVERLSWVAACMVDPEGRWLLRKVLEGPILRGLWLPPLATLATLESEADPKRVAISLGPEGLSFDGGQLFGAVRHSITHRRIKVVPVLMPVVHADFPAAMWQWSRVGEVDGGTSTLFEKLHKAIENKGKACQNLAYRSASK